VRYKERKNLLEELKKIIEKEKVEKIVVGVSEGEMAEEIKKFAKELGGEFSAIPLELYDETLTSFDAKRMAIEAGINRKKRQEMEDAYAASIMLQNYLDSN
jgi:putative Holliday junction resolvase